MQGTFAAFALGVVFAISSSTYTRADGYQDGDFKAITTCLEEQDEARKCFLAAFEPCFEVEKERAANVSQAKAWCEMRETAVWQSLKDDAVARLGASLPEPELKELQAILANWKGDNACDFRSKHYRPMYWFFTNPATCQLRKVHYEAETILDYDNMLKEMNFEFQRAEKEKK